MIVTNEYRKELEETSALYNNETVSDDKINLYNDIYSSLNGINLANAKINNYAVALESVYELETTLRDKCDNDDIIVIDQYKQSIKYIHEITNIKYEDIDAGVEGVFDSIGKLVSSIVDAIVAFIQAIIKFIKTIFKSIGKLFGMEFDKSDSVRQKEVDKLKDLIATANGNTGAKTVDETIENAVGNIEKTKTNSTFNDRKALLIENSVTVIKELLKKSPGLYTVGEIKEGVFDHHVLYNFAYRHYDSLNTTTAMLLKNDDTNLLKFNIDLFDLKHDPKSFLNKSMSGLIENVLTMLEIFTKTGNVNDSEYTKAKTYLTTNSYGIIHAILTKLNSNRYAFIDLKFNGYNQNEIHHKVINNIFNRHTDKVVSVLAVTDKTITYVTYDKQNKERTEEYKNILSKYDTEEKINTTLTKFLLDMSKIYKSLSERGPIDLITENLEPMYDNEYKDFIDKLEISITTPPNELAATVAMIIEREDKFNKFIKEELKYINKHEKTLIGKLDDIKKIVSIYNDRVKQIKSNGDSNTESRLQEIKTSMNNITVAVNNISKTVTNLIKAESLFLANMKRELIDSNTLKIANNLFVACMTASKV